MNNLGIDLGGTNIEIGIVDSENNIIYSNSFKTDTFESAEDCCNTIFDDLSENYKHKIEAIGIGAPSVNYFSQDIENAPNLNAAVAAVLAKAVVIVQTTTVVLVRAVIFALPELKDIILPTSVV